LSFAVLFVEIYSHSPKAAGWQRKARSVARTCSEQPELQLSKEPKDESPTPHSQWERYRSLHRSWNGVKPGI